LRRDDPVRCNLIDAELLQGWLDALAEIGLRPGVFVSEAELLPDDEGVAYALFDGDQVLIKTGDQAATIDRDNLGVVLGGLSEDELRLLNEHPSSLEDLELPDRLRIAPEPGASSTDSTLGYLANRFRDHPGVINLLQGDYAPPKAQSTSSAGWRTLGTVAAAWAAVAFLALVAQGFWADLQADRLNDEAEALYRDIFPDDRRITNIRRQTLAHLGERSSEDGLGLLAMVTELGQVLGPTMQLMSVNFTAARGELAVDLVLPRYDDLERIKTALEQRQLTVEIASAETQQDNTVRARLRLGAGGGIS
jgi:general secretion pathway protein L